jgi:hypothetical protein
MMAMAMVIMISPGRGQMNEYDYCRSRWVQLRLISSAIRDVNVNEKLNASARVGGLCQCHGEHAKRFENYPFENSASLSSTVTENSALYGYGPETRFQV